MKQTWFLFLVAILLSACAQTPAPAPLPQVSAAAIAAPTSTPAAPTARARVSPTPGAPTRVPTWTPSPALQSRPGSPGLLRFSHIYILMLENHEYKSIVGSSAAPFINSLVAQYGLATNYMGIAHPSEPNYLALFSGSTQGVTDDGVYNLMGSNLADQLDAAGKTWKIFAQNYPPNCFKGSSASGGTDGAGTYARKHNPAISFADISSSPARCGNITDFDHFNPAAADFEFIAPNMCNTMHDCPVPAGDAFLKSFLPGILDSAAWRQDGVLFITWDEGSSSAGGGGHIPTLVISTRVTPGFKSAIAHNHYSILRTIEDAWGLGCLENACSANNLAEFFK